MILIWLTCPYPALLSQRFLSRTQFLTPNRSLTFPAENWPTVFHPTHFLCAFEPCFVHANDPLLNITEHLWSLRWFDHHGRTLGPTNTLPVRMTMSSINGGSADIHPVQLS